MQLVSLKDKLDDQMNRPKLLLIANINRLTQRQGYSKKGLSKHLGISAPQLSNYLNGKRFPGTDYLDKIAEYFSVPIAELFIETPLEIQKTKISLDEAFISLSEHLGYVVKKTGKSRD